MDAHEMVACCAFYDNLVPEDYVFIWQGIPTAIRKGPEEKYGVIAWFRGHSPIVAIGGKEFESFMVQEDGSNLIRPFLISLKESGMDFGIETTYPPRIIGESDEDAKTRFSSRLGHRRRRPQGYALRQIWVKQGQEGG